MALAAMPASPKAVVRKGQGSGGDWPSALKMGKGCSLRSVLRVASMGSFSFYGVIAL